MTAQSTHSILADAWWTFVVHSMWQSSLVALVVLAMVWALRERSASFLYAILTVALLKFLVPPVISLPVMDKGVVPTRTSIDSARILDSPSPANVDVADLEGVDPQDRSVAAATPAEQMAASWRVTSLSTHWMVLFTFLHTFGIAVLAAVMASSYFHLRKILRASRPADEAQTRLLNDVAARMRLRRPVKLLFSPANYPPMATGVFRPRVLLPDVLASLGDDELCAILAHEMAHHRRKDLVFIWLEHIVTLIWWFNPLVWALVRSLHRTREDCCDDVVLSLGLAQQSQYCEAILRAAKRLVAPRTPGLTFGCPSRLHPMGYRLSRIMDTTIRRRSQLTLSGFSGVVLLGIVVLPTFLPVAAEPENKPVVSDGKMLAPNEGPSATSATAADSTNTTSLGGTVRGVVRNEATGAMVDGAFVAIDHSGDAGGSNLERFQNEGIYVTAETDSQGRFTLGQVAIRQDHPFYVTAPGFVRHQETVSLTNQEPLKELEVRLAPGATIAVDVQGTTDAAIENVILRLTAHDGHLFFPAKADWPAWPYIFGKASTGRCEFRELPPGRYRAEALQTQSQTISYFGFTDIDVAQGESKTLKLQAEIRDTRVKVTIAPDPYEVNPGHPVFILGRKLNVALEPGHFVHPEDQALGKMEANALYLDYGFGMGPSNKKQQSVDTRKDIELIGLPPGEYTISIITMGKYPNFRSEALYPRWTTFEVRERESVAVEIPWVEPKGPA